MARKQDFQMAYMDTRPELTLLLLHGFPLNSMMWWPQINGLDRVTRVIAPDLRGFGRSEGTNGKYSMRVFADDCKHLLDRLNIKEPIVVCGFSMGGYIAFEFFRRYPQMVRGMILTATRAGADDADALEGRNQAIEAVRKNGAEVITSPMTSRLLSNYQLNRNDELVETLTKIMVDASEEGMIGALEAMRDRPDSTDLLPKIDVPTLVIHGMDDKIVPVRDARVLDEEIPNCELQFIPRAGHLVNMEAPKQWNAAAEAFLQSLLD